MNLTITLGDLIETVVTAVICAALALIISKLRPRMRIPAWLILAVVIVLTVIMKLLSPL